MDEEYVRTGKAVEALLAARDLWARAADLPDALEGLVERQARER